MAYKLYVDLHQKVTEKTPLSKRWSARRSSSKGLWIEKVRDFNALEFEDGQNNLVLGSSIVH